MNNPLHYQITEYDCGPMTVLNAVSFLFKRENIPPEIIRNVLIYSLDIYDDDGVAGKKGTSRSAMMFLSNWLSYFSKTGRLSIHCDYLTGEDVYLSNDSKIIEALKNGGVVAVRVYFDVSHYVLITGLTSDGRVKIFDPYYRIDPFEQKDIVMITDHPNEYNRIVPSAYFNTEEETIYSFGKISKREAVIFYNTENKNEQN